MNLSSFSPAAALSSEREPIDSRTLDRWVWMLVALGLAARITRYLLCFPLWDDECFLMVNLIDRGYGELMQPLDFHQVAPLLYLWLERTMIDWFGYNEYAMRFPALVSGIATLLLFRHIAKRLLSGVALLTAVAIFSVAYPCIRYSAEAKPYGTDLLFGLLLMAGAIEWRLKPEQSRWGWFLAALAPLAIGMSYPAAFVAGGLGLWLIPMLWRTRSVGGWSAWFAFNAATCLAFLGFFLLTVGSQSTAELPFMTEFWKESFPPLSEPWKLPFWFINVHVGSWLSYPLGGKRGGSILTFTWVVVAVVMWYRTRRRDLVGLCLLPLGLNMIAAALHRYPYGGHPKLVHYSAGPICLMAGYGLAVCVAWCARRQASLLPVFRLAAATLALIGTGEVAYDVLHPAKTLSDVRHRDFARWFWFNASFENEICCVMSDQKQFFEPSVMKELNWTAMYLCNQKIYSPRHRRNEPVHWDRISNAHPLRCVFYTSEHFPYDPAIERKWAAEMQTKYDLVAQETYPFAYYQKNERLLASMDHLKVYQFVPKQAAATAAGAADVRR
ncbi:MAG: glycosyltransferase family 39 protein [Planctomycetia bacterium]|nr:glycosyltransferase family 39 protein [Planctomycetia bacterium]